MTDERRPQTETSVFATIEEAIDEIRRGRMVVVCDDEDRENEGDLTMAAQFATPEAINFMAKEGRGLICLALTAERCDELGLDLMAAKNEAPLQTAFTVSVEAARGRHHRDLGRRPRAHDPGRDRPPLDARDRWSSPATSSRCKAKDGGVLERTGQTEAAVDLARLAGLNPAGVICEIMNEDGTMARVPRPGPVLRAPRPEDDHGRRPDRLPAPHRAAGRARRRDQAADRVRRVHRGRLPLAARRQAPRRDGQGRRRRAPRTCSSASTPSASPATSSTRCAATAASSSRRRWR